MVTMLTDEDHNSESDGMGPCLEYLIHEKVPLMLLAHAKGDSPKGLLQLAMKFIISVVTSVQKHNILV
jgi:hypothetical protein